MRQESGHGERRRTATAIGGALSLALAFAAPVRAQEQKSAPETPADPRAEMIDRRQGELRSLEEGLRLSEAQRARIQAELEIIRTDRVRLTSAMLETTARVQAAETRVADAERKLDASLAAEAAIRRSLEGRRDVIAEILASLQRMGRRPPPALLISPDDILKAIRTAMLLGSVVPELRSETEILAADLAELMSLRKSVASERDKLRTEASQLVEERGRLAALVEARRAAIGDAEKALAAEQERSAALAKQALDLKDLIARMENELAGARRAADAARKAEELRRRTGAKPGGGSPFANAARLEPAVAFSSARGLLPMPVAGEIRKAFGAPDGFGGNEKGLSISTRANAVVASPADGWVAFSGPYRTYGQLLILNAGDGYYIVLAGMARVGVEVGQFVLAGEPVGAMGDATGSTAAAIAIGAKQPILYVEFRKDGAAIDPGPWWAKTGS
ncbi:MAG: murein hydrolase activator EnvC family protein [Beijerinckiaceae bacterium]